MPLTSGKFKYLETTLKKLPTGTIPEFWKIDSDQVRFDLKRTWIMRSALKDEGQLERLQSGKSLSIGGINTSEQLESAFLRISKQEDLQEIILQEEIEIDQHYTLIWEKDFLFAELKNESRSSKFIYWTPLTKTNDDFKIKGLLVLLKNLKFLIKDQPLWLFEIGEKNGKFYIFQVQPISPFFLNDLFTQDLVKRVIASRIRFSKKPGFMNLIQTEFKAKIFRNKAMKQKFKPSLVFQNWEYIFHYFRIFCMMKRVQPSGEVFTQFLSEAILGTFLGSLLKNHLILANLFRKNEKDDEMNITFEDSGMRFIGKGTHHVKMGGKILVTQTLGIDQVYSKEIPEIIITKDVSLLSHPVLASVEKGIFLVLGLDDATFNQLIEGKSVFLDFENKIFRLE